MRHVTALCLGLCLGIASAPADAGVGVPHGTEICGETQLAGDLSDANTVYAEIESPAVCKNLCNQTESTCRATVKAGYACILRVQRVSAKFTKTVCDYDFDGQAARDCKANADEFWLAGIPDLKEQRALQLDECADWGAVCRANSCD